MEGVRNRLGARTIRPSPSRSRSSHWPIARPGSPVAARWAASAARAPPTARRSVRDPCSSAKATTPVMTRPSGDGRDSVTWPRRTGLETEVPTTRTSWTLKNNTGSELGLLGSTSHQGAAQFPGRLRKGGRARLPHWPFEPGIQIHRSVTTRRTGSGWGGSRAKKRSFGHLAWAVRHPASDCCRAASRFVSRVSLRSASSHQAAVRKPR
jgi:hypothetical protein